MEDGVLADVVVNSGDVLEFSLVEVSAVVGRIRSRNKAPGPDKIPSLD